jgi:enamine deaminase RidA (YjgF/YER057c/UK114 family)
MSRGRSSPTSSRPVLTSPTPDQLAKYADLRKQYFGSASPARTIVKEGGLSNSENLVEVMAFAAVQ